MSRTHRSTPHLFAHWNQIERRIRRNKRVALFLDFDGTLVRIAPKPDAVRLEEWTRDVLKKLAAHPNVTLAVISGRRRLELQRYIGVRKLKYMGLYGWESDASKRLAFDVRVALARALVELLNDARLFPGVWIEPKRNSFSVHLLAATPEMRRDMREQVERRIRPLRDRLKTMTNLRDIEVAPVAIGDKGVAVRKLLGAPGLRGALPIYFGDDLSDEPAFTAARKGISVLVGKRRATHAQFSLRGPAEVTAALSKLAELVG